MLLLLYLRFMCLHLTDIRSMVKTCYVEYGQWESFYWPSLLNAGMTIPQYGYFMVFHPTVDHNTYHHSNCMSVQLSSTKNKPLRSIFSVGG